MSKWIIRDWMGHDTKLETGKSEYVNYGDARSAISEFADWLTSKAIENGKYERESIEHEEALQGIEEDLYAVNIDDNGKEIEDNGQYSY